MSVLSPLNVKRFDKYTLYIYQSHTSHSLFTLFNLWAYSLWNQIFFSQTENLEPPKPSSKFINDFIKCNARNCIIQSESSSLRNQGKNHVTWRMGIDRTSWKPNRLSISCSPWMWFKRYLSSSGHNGLLWYVKWSNLSDLGSTLLGKAKLYDQKAAKLKMDENVLIDPSLEGKTREFQ